MKTQTTIRNCPRQFDMICPKKWEELDSTSDEGVRWCSKCEQSVYFCTTDEETLAHARAGHCIARECPDGSELPEMYLGRPSKPVKETESQKMALKWRNRERGIDDALKNLDSNRCCPKCHYPAPPWRVDCRVCGFAFGRVPF